jgi:hypothetical protein
VRSRLSRRSLPLAVAGSLAASMAVAAAAPPAAGSLTALTRAATVQTGPAGRPGVPPVLLITGARLAEVAGPGGRPATLVMPSRPSAAADLRAILTMGPAGHLARVPVAAVPFLGQSLDPALFDLAALRRAEHGGRLPVQITYHGPVPQLPGVTITHAATGTATGFLTAQSAPAFGAALSRQFTADHQKASYGTDGLFAHGVRIALAGTPHPRPVRPRFVMHTLTIHGTDLAGRPDNGDIVILVNADSTNRGQTTGVFRHGMARVSVPAGH